MRAMLLLACAGCGARTGLAQRHATSDGGTGHDASSCVAEIIASDPNGAGPLAIDGDTVFWGTTDGQVRRHDANGNVTLAAENDAIASVAFDQNNVYYTLTGALRATPRSSGVPFDIATSIGQPIAVVVDQGTFFVLDYGDGFASGRLLRIEMNGTVTELFNGFGAPSALVVDDTSAYVATQSLITKPDAGLIVQIAKTGGGPIIVATGITSPGGMTQNVNDLFVVDKTDTQFTLHGGVKSVAKAGGIPTLLVPTPDVSPLDVTQDGANLYVTTFSGTTAQNKGALLRANLDGSNVTELASTPGVLYGAVRTNPSAVYWTINWLTGHPPADGASVRKLCK